MCYGHLILSVGHVQDLVLVNVCEGAFQVEELGLVYRGTLLQHLLVEGLVFEVDFEVDLVQSGESSQKLVSVGLRAELYFHLQRSDVFLQKQHPALLL